MGFVGAAGVGVPDSAAVAAADGVAGVVVDAAAGVSLGADVSAVADTLIAAAASSGDATGVVLEAMLIGLSFRLSMHQGRHTPSRVRIR